MMKYKTICFDIDGTLYDPALIRKYIVPFAAKHPFVNKTYSKLRAEYRKMQDSFEDGNLKDKPFWYREAYVLMQIRSRFKTIEAARSYLDNKYYKNLLKQFKIIGRQDETVKTIKYLQEKEIGVAFLSDWPFGNKMEQIGLSEFADRAYNADDTGYLKPSAKSFEVFLRKIGEDKSTTLYVGDSYTKDVCGAFDAGLDAVLVNCSDGFSLADKAEESGKAEKTDKAEESGNAEKTDKVEESGNGDASSITGDKKYPKALKVFKSWADFDRWVREELSDEP